MPKQPTAERRPLRRLILRLTAERTRRVAPFICGVFKIGLTTLQQVLGSCLPENPRLIIAVF